MTSPVLGCRFFFARDESLYPFHGRTAVTLPWIAGVNEAACRNGDHDEPPPGDDCGCGLHSFYDLDWMLRWLKLSPIWETRYDHPRGKLVFAVTRSWGRIAAGRQTMAAQYAEILALIDTPELDDLERDDLLTLARAYGVPLVPFAGAGPWAAEFGPTMPHELRPAHPVAS
jgi:hypothetical protein